MNDPLRGSMQKTRMLTADGWSNHPSRRNSLILDRNPSFWMPSLDPPVPTGLSDQSDCPFLVCFVSCLDRPFDWVRVVYLDRAVFLSRLSSHIPVSMIDYLGREEKGSRKSGQQAQPVSIYSAPNRYYMKIREHRIITRQSVSR